MRRFVLVLLFLVPALAQEPPAPVPPELKARIEALEKLAGESPTDMAVLMLLGNAYASAHEKDKAVAALQRIAESRCGLVPPADQEFFLLKEDPSFQRALEAARAASPIVKHATVAMRVKYPDLVPEGLAYDRGANRFLLGGLYTKKILSVDKKGRARDFAAGDAIAVPVLGMKVQGGDLWAVTSWPDETHKPRSSVLRFDRRTGALLATYVPEDKDAALNDLTVSEAGDVFVSDSGPSGAVYRILRDAKTIEPFLPPGSIRYGNGIVVTPDGRSVFLGNWRGIWRIDADTRKFARLEHDAGISASAIDGLYLHRGALVGIQNYTHPGRVVRWTMNAEQTRLVRQEVLESGNAALEEPTTGTLVGDTFYFIANSQIRRMSDDGASLKRPVDPETVILKLPL